MQYAPYANGAVDGTTLLAVSGYGSIAGIALENPNASNAYLQIFDAAKTSDVTLGTTPPTAIIPLAAGWTIAGPWPQKFNKGIVIAATTTPTGSTGLATAMACTITFQ